MTRSVMVPARWCGHRGGGDGERRRGGDGVKVIGCSNLRGGGGELGTNKKLDLWLQLVCTKLKLIQAI
jgi:hypothetical protein